MNASKNDEQWSVYSYALLQASLQGDIEAVTDCLENGAFLEATDQEGRTPLMLACSTPYKSAVKIVELLLTCGANVWHHDLYNNTLAHMAAKSGNEAVLLILKANGAPLDSCNLKMQTPLLLSKSSQITSFLLASGSKIYTEDMDGNTPSIAAVNNRDIKALELLLQYAAYPTVRNKVGQNAVSLAWENKLPEYLHLMYKYDVKRKNMLANINEIVAEGSSDFEIWLTNALHGTPSSFDRNAEIIYDNRGTMNNVVLMSADDEVIPYFSMVDVEDALKKPMDEDRPRYLKQMRDAGNMRIRKRIPDEFNFDILRKNFPNFDKVSDFLECQIELCRLSPKKVADFQPLLLLGDPGVGKTRYLLEASKLLGLEFNLIQCGGVSANFVLSGSSTSWKNGKPGKIHTALRDGKTINPILMLDEIDKLAGSIDYDAHGPFYQLLEKRTAVSFHDECIDVSMDCSNIIWIATANHINMIPDAIVSRLVVIDVPTPYGSQLIQITKSIYSDILLENNTSWGERFNKDLSNEVLNSVTELTPREIRKILLSACGNTALRCSMRGNFTGMLDVSVGDLDTMPKSSRARSAGFMN